MYTKKAEIIEKSALLWYNICMRKQTFTNTNYTPIQMKFQLVFETIIEISDPIYTFNEIVNQIDLRKYFVEKDNKMGRPRFDCIKMLKIILFAFMENGYSSLRNIEKLCKTDIRFMWLLDDAPAPTFMTISNFMNDFLVDGIEEIFNDINQVIFETENEELTSFHIEVLNNLNCIHGALLRMNRSIQSEGTYGVIKCDRGCNRIRRRGLKSVIFEFTTICCGFNLYKYHMKKQRAAKTAA